MTYDFTSEGPGTYDVCVYVEDELGNTDDCCVLVTVNPPLDITCDVTVKPALKPVTIVSNQTITSRNIQVQHAVAVQTGDVVEAGGDIKDSDFTKSCECCVENQTIDITQVAVQENTNAIDIDVALTPNPTVGHEADFTASASGGVPPYSWSWTVDGTEVATTQNTTYTFDTPGTYTVCVTVTDSLGNEEECCKDVTVKPALKPVTIVSNQTITSRNIQVQHAVAVQTGDIVEAGGDIKDSDFTKSCEGCGGDQTIDVTQVAVQENNNAIDIDVAPPGRPISAIVSNQTINSTNIQVQHAVAVQTGDVVEAGGDIKDSDFTKSCECCVENQTIDITQVAVQENTNAIDIDVAPPARP